MKKLKKKKRGVTAAQARRDNQRIKEIYGVENKPILVSPLDIEKQINRAIAGAREEQIGFDLEYITAGVLMALHNELGWGKVRLQRVAARISKDFLLATDEKISTLNDYKEYLQDMGIQFSCQVKTEPTIK